MPNQLNLIQPTGNLQEPILANKLSYKDAIDELVNISYNINQCYTLSKWLEQEIRFLDDIEADVLSDDQPENIS